MTEFFEPIPVEPDDEEMDGEMPPWMQSPEWLLPAIVPDRRVLVREGPVAIVLSHIDAYPMGIGLVLRVVGRRPEGMSREEWWTIHEALMDGPYGPMGGSSADQPLRFGLQYADGTKVTDSGDYGPDHDHLSPPGGPLIVHDEGGGSGGGRTVIMDHSLWVWPLPPAESFDLVFEWRAMGIELTRVSIDGAAIAAASKRAEPLFP